MVRRHFLLALLWLAAAPVAAQDATTASTAAPVRVRLDTAAGAVVIELESAKAPITTANFLRYVDQKRYDGAVFYRSMKMNGTGLVQGGVRDSRKLLPPIAHEPTTRTGLSHVEAAVSIARGAPGSATSDFFILTGSMTGLDAQPKNSGDNLGFAVFGRVVEGMDVVRKIQDSPVSATKGEGPMKGQMLEPEIRITSARRVK